MKKACTRLGSHECERWSFLSTAMLLDSLWVWEREKKREREREPQRDVKKSIIVNWMFVSSLIETRCYVLRICHACYIIVSASLASHNHSACLLADNVCNSNGCSTFIDLHSFSLFELLEIVFFWSLPPPPPFYFFHVLDVFWIPRNHGLVRWICSMLVDT